MLLRATLCGGVWNVFLVGQANKDDVPCQFCSKKVIVLGVHLSPLLLVGELPEFAALMSPDRSKWPRCLQWYGWLPGLSGAGESDRWATSLGTWPAVSLSDVWVLILWGYWTPPDYWDAEDVALEMSDHPNIWIDGSREDFSSIGGFEVAGACVYLPASEVAIESSVWRTAEEYVLRCRRIGLSIWVLITSMLPGLLGGSWTRTAWLSLCLWSRMGMWSLLLST